MKIDKTCKTCEFCFHEGTKKICASAYYGEEIKDFKTQKECWEISFPYFCELREKLEQVERDIMDDLVTQKCKNELYQKLNVSNDTEFMLKVLENR